MNKRLIPDTHTAKITEYDQKVHTLSQEYKNVLLEKGIEKSLLKGFLETIKAYSTDAISIKAYSDYVKGLEAVLTTLRTMDQKNFTLFCEALKKWLDTIEGYKIEQDTNKYITTREMLFNKLFRQIGDAASKRRVATARAQRDVMENLKAKRDISHDSHEKTEEGRNAAYSIHGSRALSIMLFNMLGTFTSEEAVKLKEISKYLIEHIDDYEQTIQILDRAETAKVENLNGYLLKHKKDISILARLRTIISINLKEMKKNSSRKEAVAVYKSIIEQCTFERNITDRAKHNTMYAPREDAHVRV